MKSKLKNAFKNGEKVEIIPINRLTDLQNDLNKFKNETKLNGFQKWIIDDLYNYNIPDTDYIIKSIILVAVPHPLYADVELTYEGKKFNTTSVVMSDFNSAQESVSNTLSLDNYNYTVAGEIPLKRLAVQSGFAKYGRNNICYIEGLGSLFSFIAFFSDVEPVTDNWKNVEVAQECSNCKVCRTNCPTGAILDETFLVDTDRCLSFWNESSDPFPSWIPKSAHHTIYDCTKCQITCPMNRGLDKIDRKKIFFSEEETLMLLNGVNDNTLPPSFRNKVDYLGLDQWPDGIPKNLKLLFEKEDINQIAKDYGSKVSRLSHRMIRNSDLAEEAAQEAWYEIIKTIGSFKGKSHISTWIYTVAKRTIIKYANTEKRITDEQYTEFFNREAISYDGPKGEEKNWAKEKCDYCLTAFCHCLNTESRLIFLFRLLAKLDYAQISEIMELSTISIRKKLSRAKKKVSNFMDNNCILYNPHGDCKCRIKKHVVSVNLHSEYAKLRKAARLVNIYKDFDKKMPSKNYWEKLI